MNSRLKKLKDGAGRNANPIVWFKTRTTAGLNNEFGEIWWPFALAWQVDETWTITHLPSGMSMPGSAPTAAEARRVIKKLRTLAVDWTFTKLPSPLWGIEQQNTVRAVLGPRFKRARF